MDRLPYVPCLRWKQGEYQALSQLSPVAKEGILPLIEVSEIGFDFETRSASKSIDEHLAPFSRRVRRKWGRGECLVDLRHVGLATPMGTGQDALTFVFDELRAYGCLAEPVVTLGDAGGVRTAIRAIAERDSRGIAVRLRVEEAAAANVAVELGRLLEDCGTPFQESDLVVDAGAPAFDPVEEFAAVLDGIVVGLPHLDTWRRVALIGTSFPATMASVARGLSILPRSEWTLYQALGRRLRDRGVRIPCFGDYVINHPDVPAVDMRLVKPYASLRYTIEEGWLVARGDNVRDYQFRQFRDLCGLGIFISLNLDE